jgi:hypothetical protein
LAHKTVRVPVSLPRSLSPIPVGVIVDGCLRLPFLCNCPSEVRWLTGSMFLDKLLACANVRVNLVAVVALIARRRFGLCGRPAAIAAIGARALSSTGFDEHQHLGRIKKTIAVAVE